MGNIFRRILRIGSLNTLKLLNEIFSFPFFKKIRGKIFYFSPHVFSPQFFVFSSTLFANHLFVPKGANVLDLGTGSGILAIFAAERANQVIATDISPYAIENARINVKINKLSHKIKLHRGYLFRPIHEKYDVILFNPPYFPIKPKTYREAAWCCGENYVLLKRFLAKVRNYLTSKGIIQISLSSYMDLNYLRKLFKKNKLRPILVARKFLFFEIIYIYILIPEK